MINRTGLRCKARKHLYTVQFKRIHEGTGLGSMQYQVVCYDPTSHPVYKPVDFIEPSTDWHVICQAIKSLEELERRANAKRN